MPFGALCQKKSSAARDLEALMNKLVLVGMSKKAQVDARAPDCLSVLIAEKLAISKDRFECIGLESASPES